jgi:hypothetical protein
VKYSGEYSDEYRDDTVTSTVMSICQIGAIGAEEAVHSSEIYIEIFRSIT